MFSAIVRWCTCRLYCDTSRSGLLKCVFNVRQAVQEASAHFTRGSRPAATVSLASVQRIRLGPIAHNVSGTRPCVKWGSLVPLDLRQTALRWRP